MKVSIKFMTVLSFIAISLVAFTFTNCGESFEQNSFKSPKKYIMVQSTNKNGDLVTEPVSYRVYNNKVIIDGDIDIGSIDILQTGKPIIVNKRRSSIVNYNSRQSVAKVDESSRWGSVISYVIMDKNFEDSTQHLTTFTEDETAFIIDSFNRINKKFNENLINIQFRHVDKGLVSESELQNMENLITILKDQRSSFVGAGVASIGYRGKGLEVNTITLKRFYGRTFKHELLHVLGFWHEHQHPDSQSFLRFNPENAKEFESELWNNNLSLFDTSYGVTPFNAESIMLYKGADYTFSKLCLANVSDDIVYAYYDTDQPGVKAIAGVPVYEPIKNDSGAIINYKIANIDSFVTEPLSFCTVKARSNEFESFRNLNGHPLPYMVFRNPVNGSNIIPQFEEISDGDYAGLRHLYPSSTKISQIVSKPSTIPNCMVLSFNIKPSRSQDFNEFDHIDIGASVQVYKGTVPRSVASNISDFSREEIINGVRVTTKTCFDKNTILSLFVTGKSDETRNNTKGGAHIYGEKIFASSIQFKVGRFAEVISEPEGVLSLDKQMYDSSELQYIKSLQIKSQ